MGDVMSDAARITWAEKSVRERVRVLALLSAAFNRRPDDWEGEAGHNLADTEFSDLPSDLQEDLIDAVVYRDFSVEEFWRSQGIKEWLAPKQS